MICRRRHDMFTFLFSLPAIVIALVGLVCIIKDL
nr:MAG TPA: hypothetical protein [Caudoviricetes sp.]